MAYRLLFQAVTFSGVGGILNLSRCDPAKVSTGHGSQNHFHPNVGGSPYTLVSTVTVGACHLMEPKANVGNGKSQKLMEGRMIEGEYERLVGAIGHIINKAEFKSQFYGGFISFATAFSSTDNGMSCQHVYGN